MDAHPINKLYTEKQTEVGRRVLFSPSFALYDDLNLTTL
jgi:hypothetical protein